MCRAIDACFEVDEVKDLRDKAMAMEHYARQARNPEPERRACEIRLRAERKAGQLLKDMEKAARGPDANGQGSQRATAETPTLSDMGVSKDQSSRWQKLADVPEEQFEAALAAPEKPSTTGIIRANGQTVADDSESDSESATVAESEPVAPMDPNALWVWGRLRDFERDGVLDENPITLLSVMTDGMQADVRRLARPVAEWLEAMNHDQ
ncbi:MAG: hypothetical protein F4092_00580 [Rhodospirillaceae bacterium]|nr:hypothetical protein [Rhodospirillaceae bacterium]MYJ70270.1 hypothetical protein [Rhodospirillaceae bacterium]